MAKFFVKKGSIVTCVEGHRLYKIRRHIKRGELIKARDFEALEGIAEPIPGTKYENCPICNAIWFKRGRGWAFRIHLESGWAK